MSDERIERLRAIARNGPSRRLRVKLTDSDARGLTRGEVAAGEGRALSDIDIDALTDRVRFGRGVDRFRRPDWIGELSASNATSEEVVKVLTDKVLNDPHEETLRAAQLLLNDLGRTDLGSDCFEAITQELVTRITREGKG